MFQTAKAIVSEVEIRTDEGVPVRREGEKCLLKEWFAISSKSLHKTLPSYQTSRKIPSLICNRREINCCEQKQKHWIAESLAINFAAHQQHEMPVLAEGKFRNARASNKKNQI